LIKISAKTIEYYAVLDMIWIYETIRLSTLANWSKHSPVTAPSGKCHKVYIKKDTEVSMNECIRLLGHSPFKLNYYNAYLDMSEMSP
jgi:hypothetical protein